MNQDKKTLSESAFYLIGRLRSQPPVDSEVNMVADTLANIRNEALEEAAKIVEESPENTYSMDCDHKGIGEAIRSRKA